MHAMPMTWLTNIEIYELVFFPLFIGLGIGFIVGLACKF